MSKGKGGGGRGGVTGAKATGIEIPGAFRPTSTEENRGEGPAWGAGQPLPNTEAKAKAKPKPKKEPNYGEIEPGVFSTDATRVRGTWVYPSTPSENLSIAKTIVQQFGNKALAMVGARNINQIKGGIQFQVGGNAKGINKIQIRLMANDTYSVDMLRQTMGKNPKIKPISHTDDVYFDSLRDVIASGTGMATAL